VFFFYLFIYLGYVMIPVSLKLWKSRGRIGSDHSRADDMWGLEITLRCEAKASHKIKINSINATKDRRDPNDDTTFHFMKASG